MHVFILRFCFFLLLNMLESIIEKSGHELRSKEEEIALIKKMVLEKEETNAFNQNKRLDLNQVSSLFSF